MCVYLKPTNISDALSLMSYIAAGLAYINFSDCIKDTLIVQSHVSSDCFIRKYSVSINISYYMRTVNREIFNGNKFSRLAESTKNKRMKINERWKFIRHVSIIAPFAWHN